MIPQRKFESSTHEVTQVHELTKAEKRKLEFLQTLYDKFLKLYPDGYINCQQELKIYGSHNFHEAAREQFKEELKNKGYVFTEEYVKSKLVVVVVFILCIL
jgi:hypothetical protein